MFTGIIETLGQVKNIVQEDTNLHLFIESSLTPELKIDQSVAHNGICLTVVGIDAGIYQVTAIDETLKKSNLGQLKCGDLVNLERCTLVGGRLDGHLVQGHVDQTAVCIAKQDQQGSHIFTFRYQACGQHLTVEKGSISINGISLTVFDSKDLEFSVALIPYTLAHTNLGAVEVGDTVNLEFDIVGKYIAKIMASRD